MAQTSAPKRLLAETLTTTTVLLLVGSVLAHRSVTVGLAGVLEAKAGKEHGPLSIGGGPAKRNCPGPYLAVESGNPRRPQGVERRRTARVNAASAS